MERRRERERGGGGGRLTRCVWAVSLRHQLDGRSKECAHACAHVAASVCARAVCTDADRPLCSIGAGGLAKMAVSEARRGEARRDETRRSEERLENGKNGEANSRARTHTYTRAHSPSPCFGPATINERRAKIVLCFHPPSHRSFLPALHLPPFVASLSRGMGSIGTIRRLSGFLRGGEDQHIGADSRKSWCEFDGEKNRQSLISIVKFLSFFF